MVYTFKLPDLGEGVAEGEIAAWLVEVGQSIDEDDPLVEIQTDKTTVEIPSPVAGRVTAILADAGAVVPIGTGLVVIGGEEADAVHAEATAEAVAAAALAPSRPQATPAVRKLAS